MKPSDFKEGTLMLNVQSGCFLLIDKDKAWWLNSFSKDIATGNWFANAHVSVTKSDYYDEEYDDDDFIVLANILEEGERMAKRIQRLRNE